MKKSGKIALCSIAALTAVAGLTALWLSGSSSGTPGAEFEVKTLCKSGGVYEKYRIPGIVATKKNTLLAYFEARSGSGDWSAMDIVLFRSTDCGESFSDSVCIAQGTKSGATLNNPVIVVGNDNTLFFLYCREYGIAERNGGVFLRKSTDDGLTWSEERDITEYTLPEYRNAFATGPGHGICLENGTLIVPVWLVPKSAGAELTSHHPAEVRIFSSTDAGETWQLSEKVPDGSISDPNETAAAICSDGSVLLNIRVPESGLRGVSRSANGISDYSDITLDNALKDPTCFGSLTQHVFGGVHTILFVNCESTVLRTNLTVKGSTDDGKSWTSRGVIDSGLAGYSDIAVDGNGKIYVLYETKNCRTASLARFGIDFLRQLSAEESNKQ